MKDNMRVDIRPISICYCCYHHLLWSTGMFNRSSDLV